MKRLLSISSCMFLAMTTFASASSAIAAGAQPVTVMPIQPIENIEFPDIQKSYLNDAPRYDPSELIHINNGINDDTVRQLIGNPHFNEFNSDIWDYILNIRVPESRNYIQCRLQLHFNEDDVVENHYWGNPECARAVASALQPQKVVVQQSVPMPVVVAAPAPEPVPAPEPEVRTFTLSSDLLFDFDSAALKSSSVAAIDQMIANINKEYQDIERISVVGHTDHIGDDSYNDRLSLQRAHTVKQALERSGLQSIPMTVTGMGESMPVTDGCQNMSLAQKKLCLAPDRRVEVEVTGTLK